MNKVSDLISNFRFKVLSLIGLILVFFCLPEGLHVLDTSPSFSSSGLELDQYDAHFLGLMLENASETNWIVTDKPMYAFRAGLLVPPELAVFSKKRVTTGYITQKEIIEIIHQYQPEQIFLERFDFPEVEAILEENYTILYARQGKVLFIRSDISPGLE